MDDLRPPGTVHAALVRSPHAHARVTRIDARAALALPGVLAVFTPHDAPEFGAGVPPLIREPGWPRHHHPLLANPIVRHVGEAVAVVVAEDAYLAADAVEAVDVEYAPLPVASGPGAAAPALVHEGWRDNVAGVNESAVGDAARALAEADVVVETHLTYPRVTGVPIEGRAVLAAPDAESGRLTVWSSTQVPFNVRTAIADALGLPEAVDPGHRPRRRRRIRHQGSRLSRGGADPRAGPAPGPAGEVDRDAARALPHRLRRSRSGAHRAHRPAARRHDRGDRYRLRARSRRLSHAGRRHDRQHHQPPGRSLPCTELSRAGDQLPHAQELRRRLPGRRPAGGRAGARSPARSCRARPRHGSRRSAPAQPGPARRHAVRHRPHLP